MHHHKAQIVCAASISFRAYPKIIKLDEINTIYDAQIWLVQYFTHYVACRKSSIEYVQGRLVDCAQVQLINVSC